MSPTPTVRLSRRDGWSAEAFLQRRCPSVDMRVTVPRYAGIALASAVSEAQAANQMTLIGMARSRMLENLKLTARPSPQAVMSLYISDPPIGSCLDTDQPLRDNAIMKNSLIVQGLQFQGYCGVTLEERRQAQPLMVDVELECSYEQAIVTDSITHTVDYATVAARIVELGSGEAFALIETLADRMTQTLFAEFPITALELWVRKLSPQLPHIQGSVGIRLTRQRGDKKDIDQSLQFRPATFLTEQLVRLPKGDTLDVATGSGRNAFYLAERGFTVEGIDRDEEALASIASRAQQRNLTNLTVRAVDLEVNPQAPPDLGKERYDVILVFFYLFRPLFPALLQALKPGGFLLYETFLIDNHRRYQHPCRSEFCLAHNELLRLIPEFRVLRYDEGEHEGPRADEPTFTARLLAQKPRPDGSAYGSH